MKLFAVLALSMMSLSVFAFECEVKTFYYGEPCVPFHKPWSGEGGFSCTKYAGGVAKVSGYLDERGQGRAEISFNGDLYEMDCYPNQRDAKHSDCRPASGVVLKGNFSSRYNGETISFKDASGRFFSSDINHCDF